MVSKKKIDWKNYFNKKKKKEKSPLDLNDLFPGYFHKNIFRGVVIVMILFTIFVYFSNDGLKFNYISCPENTKTFCEYYNASGSLDLEQEPIIMLPGETIGKAPNFWAKEYNSLCLLMVWFGFILNHTIYFNKSRKFAVPVNKNKWDNIKEGFKNGIKNIK